MLMNVKRTCNWLGVLPTVIVWILMEVTLASALLGTLEMDSLTVVCTLLCVCVCSVRGKFFFAMYNRYCSLLRRM